ncbi:hypothetical protein Ahy_B10g103895 [Arachis hypogaea]|uniref:PB1-like domain-containing protein n=1 Tax=Arachis hypogaea TaxID=3818 RepID=A0A444X4B7_ARAHY|nr:hypothetical protein Ahy_B10g103895 [Arachis hypogaea]
MERLLDIMFNHGGTFKKNVDGKLVYSPDNRACLGDLDEDTLDVFFVRNYFKELGYDKVVECWWLISERSLEVGLRALTTDDELREMCFHAQMNDGVVDVYFEYGVSTPELMEGKEAVLCLDYIQEEEPDVPANTPTTRPIHDDTKSMADHENPKLYHIPNPESTTKPNTTPTVKQNPKPKQNQKPKKTQPKPKPKFTSKPKHKFNPPKRITRSQGRGHWSANKGKSSSDEESSEDDSYVPVQEASSSSDDELEEVKKVQKASAMAKGKEKMYKDTIMQDDDAIVADLSDVEVDFDFLGSPGNGLMYDALNPGAESDENSNRAANRAWLASKLVKKVRKYPNFKQCEAATYFRSKKESKNWVPIWTGDEAYEKFEVHGQPTNMVVDLGKRLCTYQFWMLTGIPCVHVCAALAWVNKRPEDFCHPLTTMDSYRKTYEHYINPLPGQSMWEKSAYSQPQAPNIKRKPGKLTTKRRKDADEGTSLNKKAKQAVTLKRQLKPFTCTYCGAPPPPTTRPPKLPTKRRTSPQLVTTSIDPMQGASVATSSRLASFMKFVPTPQFKTPRKKNP